MNTQESDIKRLAVERIASIFSVPANEIDRGWKFGRELKSSFRSDFRRNEIDRINDDIHDVADQETLRDFKSGILIISTVGDYCDFMVRCEKKNNKKVLQLLRGL